MWMTACLPHLFSSIVGIGTKCLDIGRDWLFLPWKLWALIISNIFIGLFLSEIEDLSEEQAQDEHKQHTQSYRDDTAIPPWIRTTYTHHNFIDKLHMELVDFCLYVSPTKSEHSIRLSLIQRIEKIVLNLWPKASIHVFGSMKTKLYLPTSDIDLLIYSF